MAVRWRHRICSLACPLVVTSPFPPLSLMGAGARWEAPCPPPPAGVAEIERVVGLMEAPGRARLRGGEVSCSGVFGATGLLGPRLAVVRNLWSTPCAFGFSPQWVRPL